MLDVETTSKGPMDGFGTPAYSEREISSATPELGVKLGPPITNSSLPNPNVFEAMLTVACRYRKLRFLLFGAFAVLLLCNATKSNSVPRTPLPSRSEMRLQQTNSRRSAARYVLDHIVVKSRCG